MRNNLRGYIIAAATTRTGDSQIRGAGREDQVEELCSGSGALGEVRGGAGRPCGVGTCHLPVDGVSLIGIRCELDVPEGLIVGGKDQRGTEEEEGGSSHGRNRWGVFWAEERGRDPQGRARLG